MLTIKELAPYLPYRLKGKSNQYDSIDLLLGIYGTMGHSLTLCHRINNHNTCDYDCNVNEFKPILRPLSDLIKEIEVNGKKFVPIDKLLEIAHCNITIPKTRMCLDDILYGYKENIRRVINEDMPLFVYNKLLEWHFDVFGLIEKDLAIDINKLVKS